MTYQLTAKGIIMKRYAASLPDDPGASFADRLLLALGMWPHHIEQLGEEAAIEAASLIKWNSHRFPMVCEDYGNLADEHQKVCDVIDKMPIDYDDFVGD